MPHLNGLEASRQIWRPIRAFGFLSFPHMRMPPTRTCARHRSLWIFDQADFSSTLTNAIRVVATGKSFFCPRSPSVWPSMKKQLVKQPAETTLLSTDLPRVRGAPVDCGGVGHKQTAAELGISIKTVEKHVSHSWINSSPRYSRTHTLCIARESSKVASSRQQIRAV